MPCLLRPCGLLMAGASAGHAVQAATVSTAPVRPRASQTAGRPERRRNGVNVPEQAIPTPIPVKISPLATPRRRLRNQGKNARRGRDHHGGRGKARNEAPDEIPAEPPVQAAGQQAEAGQGHEQAQAAPNAHGPHRRGAQQRPCEVAGDVGGAQIRGVAGGEPMGADKGRDERRVAETGEPQAEQG